MASSVCTFTEPEVDEPVMAEEDEAVVVAVLDEGVVDGVSGAPIDESERPSSSASDESRAEPVGPPDPCVVIALASARKSKGASSPAAAAFSPDAAAGCCCLVAASFLDCADVGVRAADLAAFEEAPAGGEEEAGFREAEGDLEEAGASARALVNSPHESSLSVDVPRFPASPGPAPAADLLSALGEPFAPADWPSNFDQSESRRPAPKCAEILVYTYNK